MHRFALVCIVAVSLLLMAACARRESAESIGGYPEGSALPIENSGKTLAGTYALKTASDEYSKSGSLLFKTLEITFDAEGNFRETAASSDGAGRLEEGTYVIGTRNELALYVEKMDSEPLAAARVERYEIKDNSNSALKLRYGNSIELTLQRQ